MNTTENDSIVNKFLSDLAGKPAPPMMFAAFRDKKYRDNAQALDHQRGTFDNLKAELRAQNKTHCVFYAVNEIEGDTRGQDHVKATRAVYLDFDGTKCSEQLPEFPLKPHYVIETSLGNFQCLWFTKDMPVEHPPKKGRKPRAHVPTLHETIHRRMVEFYGHDKGCSGVERILRLPGFINRKKAYEANPPVAHVVQDNVAEIGRRYTAAEICKWLGFKPGVDENSLMSTSESEAPPVQKKARREATDDDVAPPPPIETLREALMTIPADDRLLWFKIGAILYRSYGGSEETFSLWDSWAQTSSKYEPGECRDKWGLHDIGKPVARAATVASIVYLARQSGWKGRLKLWWPHVTDKGAKVKTSVENVRAFLEYQGIEVWQNTFDGDVYLGENRRFDDGAIHELHGLAHKSGFLITPDFINNAVMTIAQDVKRHPVQEYLSGLVWDGVPRMDSLFPFYFGAKDTPLNRAMSRLFLVGAVRRIKRPGVKFDYAPVLIGEQGRGKSLGLRKLARRDDWFTDDLPVGSDSKVVIEQTRGIWIAELAELAGLAKRDVESVKAFVTRQIDKARGAYERKRADIPRQFVIAATTNKESPFVDDTGNRRFIPVEIGDVKTHRLDEDVDQLWAEAVEAEREHGALVLPVTVLAAARIAQEARRERDPLEERVHDLIGGIEHGQVVVADLYDKLELKAPVRRNDARSITVAMKEAGWLRKRDRATGGSFAGRVVEVFVKKGHQDERAYVRLAKSVNSYGARL